MIPTSRGVSLFTYCFSLHHYEPNLSQICFYGRTYIIQYTEFSVSTMESYEVDRPASGACADLSAPNIFNFILSMYVQPLRPNVDISSNNLFSLILLGILISYLPQHHRIISRRSSTGISPYFVLLGTTSGTCAFANILTLPASRRDLACCRELSGFECVSGVLGIAQIGVQWSCFMVM